MTNIPSQEIQENLSSSLDTWTDILLSIAERELSYKLKFTKEDLANAIYIMNEVAYSIAFHSNSEGIPIKQNLARAELYGRELRKLIKDFTGVDMHTVFEKE